MKGLTVCKSCKSYGVEMFPICMRIAMKNKPESNITCVLDAKKRAVQVKKAIDVIVVKQHN